MDHFDELEDLFEGNDENLFRPKPKKLVATADDRLVDSFEEITRFVEKNGRKPDAGADDIREASLGTRLNSIRTDKKKADALVEFDELGLLDLDKAPESLDELFADDSGLFVKTEGLFYLNALPEDKRAVQNAAEAAQRRPSKDFDNKYKQLFEEQQSKLAEGLRKLTPFHRIDQLKSGSFYVYDGLMCYVVEFGMKERKAGGYSQQRLLVIFENGTESKMYRRSLAQRLYEGGSVVVDADFSDIDDSKAVGRIYVLQSLSDNPLVTTVKDLYKIGVTTGSVENRIKNARSDPTFLMSPVKIIENYRLTGELNPKKVESLIHKIFADAKLVLEITDNHGNQYVPDEWYSVPIGVINEVVDLINSGEIVKFHYDSQLQQIVSD